MKNVTIFSITVLVTSSLLICGFPMPLFSLPVKPRANIAKIYNITLAGNQKIDVRYFRKDECPKVDWCKINGTGEYLKANDWLQTGQVSRADLALMYTKTEYRKVLFWQEEGSKSMFKPKKGSCHFATDKGKFLYAHPHASADPGCEKITSKYALIFPNGTVLFIIDDEDNPDNKKFTRVGVLSSGSKHPVVAQNRKSGKKVPLRAGEFGKFFADGQIEKGEFSLADFYKEQTLGLGLGPADKDIAYVNKQEPKIRGILEEIRSETLVALSKQKDIVKLPDLRPEDPPFVPNGPVSPDDPVSPVVVTPVLIRGDPVPPVRQPDPVPPVR